MKSVYLETSIFSFYYDERQQAEQGVNSDLGLHTPALVTPLEMLAKNLEEI